MNRSPALQLRSIAQRLAESAAMQDLAAGEQDVQVSLASLKEYVRKQEVM